jgi:transposase
MFIRKNKNGSGSVSIQIIIKMGRRNKVIKTVGCAQTQREEELLLLLAKTEIERLQGTQSFFSDHDDEVIDHFVDSIGNDHIQCVGPEVILGTLYRRIGYPEDGGSNYFRHLVLCRLVYPGSKLKTVEYFRRHLDMDVSVYTVYRFLDKLHSQLKDEVEDITFEYSRKVLRGHIGIVFYDITTLYFEASEEDDWRVAGYSKDGKHQHPQIMIGLLVGGNGYPIGYEIFEGNTSEAKTLIPVLETFQNRFNLEKPIIIADAALLSQKNIDALVSGGYQYILGGRLKNESEAITSRILGSPIREHHPIEIPHSNGRLIVTYSGERAHNDKANRIKGLRKLEKRVASGKLSKKHINNRGYNKYLKLSGEVVITIDYEKFEADSVWDGLKGYITNTTLEKNLIIRHYQQLWHVEKAFRISKTDLRIRPVYHRIKQRIEAHICICFAAYAVYKELERVLAKNNISLSPEKAIREMKEIKQLQYKLPKSGQMKSKLLKLTDKQSRLMNMKF